MHFVSRSDLRSDAGVRMDLRCSYTIWTAATASSSPSFPLPGLTRSEPTQNALNDDSDLSCELVGCDYGAFNGADCSEGYR